MKNPPLNILAWPISLLTPIALLGLGLRLLLTPLFLQVEYSRPYLPPDEYGFTPADRLHWATYAWDYLLNDADISYLGNLKFGDGAPLFNQRELSHMHDVKVVMQGTLRVWYGTLTALLLLGLWAWRGNWIAAYRQGLKRGGWLTVGLAAAVGLVVIIGMTASEDVFWEFFTAFHGLFFEGDSWLFAYSDTLIRLFPIRFQQDAFLVVGAIMIAGGFGLAIGLKPAEK